ncbi:phosphotransferase [Mycolicibacterium fluoranthenivorans]|uniref:Ecdysteroid kinase n=1 Tax=Mycolicibacterium fluoranthenivorans TaxID=258505 RepID=A0A1G4VM44_9MYCO|nr:phosphotransferase [Mycolicibacterium fluoranthenivorans]SCX08850.1 Ecdysteroid kinase [Mycolicibacterium fluoranthenivorans]
MTSIISCFPRSAGELTAEWLTDVLVTAQAIAPGSRIRDVRVERIAEGVGFASFLYRAHLDVDGAGPATVIIKWPTDYPAYLELAKSIHLYDREVAFYSEVAPVAPISAPRNYFAAIENDSTDFVIVMEDLVGLENADHLAGLSIDRAQAVLDELAYFHAWGWRMKPAATKNPAFLQIDDARMAGLFGVGAAAGWPIYVEHGRASVPVGLADLIQEYPTLAPDLLGALTEPATLVNGDLRADNLFFSDTGPHVTVDYQFAGRGCGMWDVAYLVGQGLTPEERDGRERELVARYVDTLDGLGIDYPFDRAWQQFQIAVVAQIALPLLAMISWETLNPRGQELLQVLMERSFAIIADTDAVRAVRALSTTT